MAIKHLDNIIVGDNIEFECNAGENISNWKIRCEIWDSKGNSFKKATANVTGGSDNQIKITNSSQGLFSIYINAEETSNFDTVNNANIEIELETSDGKKFTGYQGTIKFDKQRINWDSI